MFRLKRTSRLHKFHSECYDTPQGLANFDLSASFFPFIRRARRCDSSAHGVFCDALCACKRACLPWLCRGGTRQRTWPAAHVAGSALGRQRTWPPAHLAVPGVLGYGWRCRSHGRWPQLSTRPPRPRVQRRHVWPRQRAWLWPQLSTRLLRLHVQRRLAWPRPRARPWQCTWALR